MIDITKLLLFSALGAVMQCQLYRTFPPLSNLVRERTISTLPANSTCGAPDRSTYCRSSTSPQSVDSCIPGYCDLACPERYELPSHSALLQATNYGVCVTKDTVNTGTDMTPYSAWFTGIVVVHWSRILRGVVYQMWILGDISLFY